MKMKKCLVFFVTILMTVATLSASQALFLSEGDIDNIRIFTPQGEKSDLSDEILSDGYIIKTENTSAVFSSTFGSISLSPFSILVVTGYNVEEPSLYLMDGSFNIELTAELDLVIYTSSASYTLSGSGEYAFTYTDSSDLAINYSDKPVQVYDALRKSESTLDGNHYSDLLSNDLNVPLEVPAETASEEEDAIPVEEDAVPVEEDVIPVEYARGIYTFASVSMEYSFATSGRGFVHYPASYVTASDINSFFASFLSDCGLEGLAGLVTYSIDEENGLADFVYADTYTKDELTSVISAFIAYLENYLAALFTPSAPSFISVDSTVSEKVPQSPSFTSVNTTVSERVPQSSIWIESVTRPSAPSFEENLKKN